ncbi:MAG: hypothetical protein IKX45_03305 [Bacteroidales bacterium]|nr:hypothetical protein [Bacteroidales bacterium]
MRVKMAILFAAIAILLCGCTKESDRSGYPRKEFVMVYYCAGFNNLSSDIRNNLEVMKSGDIPFKTSKHKLLSFTHLSKSDTNFGDLTESHLVHLYKEFNAVHADTLYTIDKSRFASDPEVLREVMEKVAELYPNAHYGLVVSSHGTGWLPAGRYSSGSYIQFSGKKRNAVLPFYRYNEDSDDPRVKSFGAEVQMKDGQKYSVEMSIQSMVQAIPVHLDYILFDACLMGGVEVAYEFKDVADKVAFSPTEVLSEGFDYSDISDLLSDNVSIEAFCKKYFDYYDKTYRTRSATISVVNTSGLEALAAASKLVFNTYRSSMNSLTTLSGIQRYYRADHHWFFDFRDILVKANVSATDLAAVDAALNGCISYKAATPYFLELQINTYSGLSMYLPSVGDAQLNEFYKTLAWNKATNLVE